MDHFLSCDWGTTSFRIRLADTNNGKILAEEKSGQGIAATFDQWAQTCNVDERKRTLFYLNIIANHIKKIEKKIGYPLNGVKVIMSGMASSSIGFKELPYSSVRVALDGSGLKTAFIEANNDFDHDVLVISGVRTIDDVMRGEETQLMGCIDATENKVMDGIYIFPGTHSKHIHVKNNQIVDFKTYMTGEIFGLLSQKSILKNAVEFDDATTGNLDSFKQGVRAATSVNLLHAAFKVRTNELFDVLSKKENYNYLSGLLIGAELNDLKETDTINLICGTNLEIYYRTALEKLGIPGTVGTFPAAWVDEAVVRGQLKIGRQLKVLV